MKKIIYNSIACLIMLVGAVFGASAVSAEGNASKAAVAVISGGRTKEFTSDKLIEAWKYAVQAEQGAVIKLLSDWKPPAALTITKGKSITFDLNGHIISRNMLKYDSEGALFIVLNNASLNIIDSSPDAPHKGIAVKGGILTGGKSVNTSGCIEMKKDSKVTIKGCSVMNCATKQNGAAVCMDGACEFTAEGTGFYSNFTQDSSAKCYGGALYIGDGKATLRSCIFDGNYCIDHGGAIYMKDGELQIQDSMFRTNHSANEGGAIYCSNTNRESMIQGTTFVSNSADGNGGAVYVNGCKQLVLYNSVLSHNTAKRNGGAVYINCDKVVLANSTVTANKTELYGGGVYVDSLHDIGVRGKVVVRNNTNSTGLNNDLCLQRGKSSTAYLSNGGLYEGSMIYITSTTTERVLASKLISNYQSSKYIRVNDIKSQVDEETAKQVEKQFSSSFFTKRNVMIICIAAVIIITAAAVFIILKKRKKAKKKAKGAGRK